MKQAFLLLLALALAAALPAVESNRNDVVWWEEDFESAAIGWTHYSLPANIWHSVGYNTWWPPVSYTRWEMGVGYTEHQYLALDTPERVLTADNATLTFYLGVENIQGPGGASAPYDGWDALNVRISTDGGTNWTSLHGSPAYDMSSSYAFGEEFGEGPGIPGWCGSHSGYASFDLSAYIGQSASIRFSFASDSTISSVNGLAYVDNISFGGYTNDGTEDGLMTAMNLGNPCADIWHLATDITAPSPTHVMKCQNAQGSYDGWVRNYLVSPPIELPSSGGLSARCMVRGELSDLGDSDYYIWEISGDAGIWENLDYWYPPNPTTEWTSAWVADLNAYAGQTMQMRISLISAGDPPQGCGLYLDDLKIYRYLEIAPAQNLVATVNGNSVTLNWLAPAGSQTREVDYYKVFRDEVLIGQIGGTLLTYTDADVPGGMHQYHVVVMDDVYESGPSNTAPAYVVPDCQSELCHDDGTAESGYGVGGGHQMAVKFSSAQSVTIRYAKIFLCCTGTQGLILRVFDASGPGGAPGAQLCQYHYLPASLAQGWNYAPLPGSVSFPAGDFYLALVETPSECLIGLDDSCCGSSYQNCTSAWVPVPGGELMLRAIVEPVVANDDNTLIPPALTISIYPNPFNPETTISYTLPASGPVSLEIYNSRGQLVRRLLHEEQPAGEHYLIWNGKDDSGHSVASGLYLCRIACNGKHETRKMLLLK